MNKLYVCMCVYVCMYTVFRRFQAVSGSDVIINADDAEVLRTLTADLSTCLNGNTLSNVSMIFHVPVFCVYCSYVLSSRNQLVQLNLPATM